MQANAPADPRDFPSPEAAGLFRAIFEQAAVGGAQIETATGRFLRVNQRYSDIVDYSREELAVLNALGRAVNATLALEETAKAALTGMLDAVHPDLAFLFLREGDWLVLREVLPLAGRLRLGVIPEHRVGKGMCGLAVREGRRLYSRDIFNDRRCAWEECQQAGLKSFAALPLRSGDQIIGVIGLASEAERDFERQAGFLETLAGQVSVVLANARLFEAAQGELAKRQRGSGPGGNPAGQPAPRGSGRNPEIGRALRRPHPPVAGLCPQTNDSAQGARSQ